MKLTPDLFQINEAWIVSRLSSPMIVQNESVDVYVLLDAASCYIFGQIAYVGETPSRNEFNALFKRARKMQRSWPGKLYIPKQDPAEAIISETAVKAGIQIEVVPPPYLDDILNPIKESFLNFLSGQKASETEVKNNNEESVWDLLPDSYDLCSCGSGKKYKFCCKVVMREITGAMCAVEDKNFSEAIRMLDSAKEKVGETAEILCRYAIAYSLKSDDLFKEWLNKALNVNPKHPRSHYLLGLQAVKEGDPQSAVASYQKAIEFYPVTDRFHLNETWNNLANVYFDLGEIQKAKGGWEKALTYLPTDQVTKRNLKEFIYDNEHLSEELRVPSPFVLRLL